MKHALLLSFAFFAFAFHCEAHPFAPPTLESVATSDTVYLVHVDSRQGASTPDSTSGGFDTLVTFSVTETLRGKSVPSLVLNEYAGFGFGKGSDWILVHNPTGFKKTAGWASKGDCEWLPISVTKDGDKATAQWIGPLGKVREYLSQHPYKP